MPTSYSVGKATSFHALVNSPLTSTLGIPILSPITWKKQSQPRTFYFRTSLNSTIRM